jgi:arabinofuranosyltransferase
VSRARIAILAAALAVVLWTIRYAVLHWDSVYDDAFIYLRYVRNLDAGCGVRFNCHGVAVEGFTSPLFLAVLWLGSLATAQLIWWCQVVTTICLAAALAGAVLLAARLADRWTAALLAAAVAVLLAADDFALLNSVTGLETSMGALAIVVLAHAAIGGRPWRIAAAACVAVLARPEAAVFVLALPMLPVMRARRPLLAVGAFLAVMTAIRFALFDTVVPNTFTAKSGGSVQHALLGLAYIRDTIADFPIIVLAPLALLGRARPTVIYLLAGTAAWIAFFVRTGGDTYEYSRLAFPLVPVLAALGVSGLHALAARRLRLPVAHGIAGAVVLVVAIRAAVAHEIPEQHAHPRVVEWIQTGTWLRDHVPHGTLIATVPIGAIGYYSALPVLDLVGLTEPAIAGAGRSVPPELLTKRWIAHERNNTEYVLERAPALIVTTEVRDRPWQTLDEARAGFYADWLLLEEIKAGRAPYHVRDALIAPDRHLLLFERD